MVAFDITYIILTGMLYRYLLHCLTSFALMIRLAMEYRKYWFIDFYINYLTPSYTLINWTRQHFFVALIRMQNTVLHYSDWLADPCSPSPLLENFWSSEILEVVRYKKSGVQKNVDPTSGCQFYWRYFSRVRKFRKLTTTV